MKLPQDNTTVLAFWRSLSNYNVRGVICAVFSEEQWCERVEFGDDDTGEPVLLPIDPTRYEVYNWQPLPAAPLFAEVAS